MKNYCLNNCELQPNGTKSKKPSAQREQKNPESNAIHMATAESSTENNTKSNQASVVAHHQTTNKPANLQPQPTAVHHVSH